jgi:phosphohistidine phosphatase SixA
MTARSRHGVAARRRRSEGTFASRASSRTSSCAPPRRGRARRSSAWSRHSATAACGSRLYGADAGTLLGRLQEIPAAIGSVMVIGHNPGLERLALVLARPGPAVRELEVTFPTGALATLAFRGRGWDGLDRGTAELIDFIRPRDLER